MSLPTPPHRTRIAYSPEGGWLVEVGGVEIALGRSDVVAKAAVGAVPTDCPPGAKWLSEKGRRIYHLLLTADFMTALEIQRQLEPGFAAEQAPPKLYFLLDDLAERGFVEGGRAGYKAAPPGISQV